MDCKMIYISNKGRKATFIKVLKKYSYFNDFFILSFINYNLLP